MVQLKPKFSFYWKKLPISTNLKLTHYAVGLIEVKNRRKGFSMPIEEILVVFWIIVLFTSLWIAKYSIRSKGCP